MSHVARPRVLIAESPSNAAEQYVKLLDPEFEVVGTVANEKALMEAVPTFKPEVIILDLEAPWILGSEAVKRIKKLSRTVRFVYITMDSEILTKLEDVRGGVSGYLLKSSAAAELVKALHKVLTGEQYVSTSILPQSRDLRPDPRDRETNRESLTDRQREVLKLLAQGRTMKEIAYILILTPRTVAFHKYKIMERFHLRTNADLIQFAIQEGVITPPSGPAGARYLPRTMKVRTKAG
jgi:DNA-binding NarL/FixJ family response regulator